MLTIHNLSYTHSNRDLLFKNINLSVSLHQKMALIGNNGTGKSTLLKLIAGILPFKDGKIETQSPVYYIPQLFGQYNHLSIGEALGIEEKRFALHEILRGNALDKYYEILEDDWTIEERCRAAFEHWGMHNLDLTTSMDQLSGGQKTKIFLAGIDIHAPQFVLMDEPSNHLDYEGRKLLYDFIQQTKCTLLIVSHDRLLLNRLDTMCELQPNGIKVYGGNYDFYKEQKEIEANALQHEIHSKERLLKKAKEKERESLERQQKLDSRGKSKQEKSGVARIMMNTLRNNAERSTAKNKEIHAIKTHSIKQELQNLQNSLSAADQMRFYITNSDIYRGKKLIEAENINFKYSNNKYTWQENLTLTLHSGDRLVIKGTNGSGKTTLVQLLLGKFKPQIGQIKSVIRNSIIIDQDYSLINDQLKVYEQAQEYNTTSLEEHEIKIRLNRFLFGKEDWDKYCESLSGGERMRLLLCCMYISNQSPDLIVLDEPTNNLDIQNIDILTKAISNYKGTLIVISHDETFLQQIHIEKTIQLS